MKEMKGLLTIFAVFAFVAISSSAFADSMRSAVGTEAGVEVVPSPKALAVSSFYTYDQAYLDAFNSEAGADIIPSAKALAAAELYQYDASKMANIADDDAQDLYFASEHQSAEINMIVNQAAENSLICSSC